LDKGSFAFATTTRLDNKQALTVATLSNTGELSRSMGHLNIVKHQVHFTLSLDKVDILHFGLTLN
jgi:hypothetical protein